MFDNLDDTVSLPNTQAGGSSLFTLAYSDTDTEDTVLTVTQTGTTGSAAAFFEYDSTTCMCLCTTLCIYIMFVNTVTGVYIILYIVKK